DVDESEHRETRRGREDRRADAAELRLGERETAAEEVGGDRDQVVARADDDAAMRGLPAEPALRQQRPDGDDSRVRERSDVAPAPPKRPPRAEPDDRERQREERLLPRGDGVQRPGAHARVPELRHHQVVQREPHHEHVEGPDRPPHAGPTATSVRPRLSTRTGYGKSAARSFGPSGSRTSSNPRAWKSRRRAAPGGSQWANGSNVWGSSGNQRFGVVTKTRCATRQSSRTNWRWPLRPPPTCSTTAFEKPSSNSASANGSSRPSARTARTCGEAAANGSSWVRATAVRRCGPGGRQT